MTNKAKYILDIKNLNVEFPIFGGIIQHEISCVHAVKDFSLKVRKGQTIAIVGESGSGKSTFGKAIINVLKLSAPDVRVNGEILIKHDNKFIDLLKLNRKEMIHFRSDIQMIFQDPYSSLNPRKPIGSIITLPLRVQGDPNPGTWRKRTEEMMELVGLPSRLFQNYPSQLSGGQRQRVAIARALINRPQVVICDEPTSALDVSVQSQILNLLQDLRNELNLTYIIISHNLAVVEHIATRVAVMYLMVVR